MEWPKLKNIIIIMLACVNLFLLVLVFHRQWESRRIAGQAREDAISVLWNTSRIRLDKEILPEELDLPILTVTQDPALERTQAAALLGRLDDSAQESMRYTGEKGTAQFYPNGAFSATFLPGAYPLNGEDPEAFAVSLLAGMSFEAEVVPAKGGEQAGAETAVTLRQLWNGVPVFDCTAVLVFQDGELREIRRNASHRLVGVPQAGEDGARRDIATLLLRFMDYANQNSPGCNELTGFTAGYVLEGGQTGSARLLPAWYVTTDQDRIAFYWNAVTGEILAEKQD